MPGVRFFLKEIPQIITNVSKEYGRAVFSTQKRQKSCNARNNKLVCRSVLLLSLVSTDPHQPQGAFPNLPESVIEW